MFRSSARSLLRVTKVFVQCSSSVGRWSLAYKPWTAMNVCSAITSATEEYSHIPPYPYFRKSDMRHIGAAFTKPLHTSYGGGSAESYRGYRTKEIVNYITSFHGVRRSRMNAGMLSPTFSLVYFAMLFAEENRKNSIQFAVAIKNDTNISQELLSKFIHEDILGRSLKYRRNKEYICKYISKDDMKRLHVGINGKAARQQIQHLIENVHLVKRTEEEEADMIFYFLVFACKNRPYDFQLLHYNFDAQDMDLMEMYNTLSKRLLEVPKNLLPRLKQNQPSITVEGESVTIPLLLPQEKAPGIAYADVFEFSPRDFFRGKNMGLGEDIFREIQKFDDKIQRKRAENGREPLTTQHMLQLYTVCPSGMEATKAKLKLGQFRSTSVGPEEEGPEEGGREEEGPEEEGPEEGGREEEGPEEGGREEEGLETAVLLQPKVDRLYNSLRQLTYVYREEQTFKPEPDVKTEPVIPPAKEPVNEPTEHVSSGISRVEENTNEGQALAKLAEQIGMECIDNNDLMGEFADTPGIQISTNDEIDEDDSDDEDTERSKQGQPIVTFEEKEIVWLNFGNWPLWPSIFVNRNPKVKGRGGPNKVESFMPKTMFKKYYVEDSQLLKMDLNSFDRQVSETRKMPMKKTMWNMYNGTIKHFREHQGLGEETEKLPTRILPEEDKTQKAKAKRKAPENKRPTKKRRKT